MEAPPLLVALLGGNIVTAACVLSCINTADATALRRLHPALVAVVAAVPWADTATPVHDADRWRAALPAATGLKLARIGSYPLDLGKALAALRGVTVVDMAGDNSPANDDVIAHLPRTLRALNVSQSVKDNSDITIDVDFTQLAALESLDCSRTEAVAAGVAHLPPSLRELRMDECMLPDSADFGHLRHLRVLIRHRGWKQLALSAATVASLPPFLEVLDVSVPAFDTGRAEYPTIEWPPGWSAAHLTRLREFKASRTNIDDAIR